MKSISFKLDENKVVNTSAWLVSLIQFANKLNFFDAFKYFNLKMKSVNYTNLNRLQTLVASIVMGCNYTSDINEKLVPDTTAAKLLGMNKFPDQSQINRFLSRFDETNIDQLEFIHHNFFMENALALSSKDPVIVDFDMSGLVASGRTYELAEKGYFPRKRGEKGYQLSTAFVGDTGETVSMFLDPGNTSCTSRFEDLLKSTTLKFREHVSKDNLIIRADSGYGSFENIQLLKATGAKFVVKGFSTQQSKNLAKSVQKHQWQKINIQVHVAEIPSSTGLRIIVCEFVGKDGKIKYSHLLTNIGSEEMDAIELFHFYNERQTIEAFFRTCKEVYGIKNLRTSKFYGIYGFLWLVFISHNLITLMKNTAFSTSKLKDMGINSLIKKLGTISAKVIELKNHVEIIIPSLSELAKLFVEALQPKYVQLSFHDFLNTA
ncbi:Transposase DDE domain-containing protein [Geosporobacter subterraneus DSM 17957]|uniref:Transposase DDE domain-containing protein n=1 Tax=Geosporobacter subterraneus DSM 17957 TaxID=1121919 RepID=A0A1M6IML3_9FIRM|nr:transposase [Geosporobacter subterraneus]SHJ35579.1 Transposase DDE domain-containing protein [Geosporobacter subterraneus DSM 17957]SHJ43337.1 Transposase DDE domain-containing protein [Geosporobacter subterraneus DSM 17957]